MDQHGFDRIARALGIATTRRAGVGAGLGAALAALAGFGRAAGQASAPAAAKSRGKGPCGDGSRTANACLNGAECCTGLCRKKAKNSGGKGRCRCVKNGGTCTQDRNCCGEMTCAAGACAPCAPNVCASGCKYASVAEAWAALPAGSTIVVGPGTYEAGIHVDKSMTIVGCGGKSTLKIPRDSNAAFCPGSLDPVTLTLRRLTLKGHGGRDQALLEGDDLLTYDVSDCSFRNATIGISSAASVASARASVTVARCDFRMDAKTGAGVFGQGLHVDLTDSTFSDSYAGVAVAAGRLRIDGCVFTNQSELGVALFNSSSPIVGMMKMTNTSFTDSKMAIYMRQATGTFDGVSISDSTLTDELPGAVYLSNGSYSLSNVTISGNTSTEVGAGLAVDASLNDVAVTLGENVSITGNTAVKGAGIALVEPDVAGTFRATITGAPEAVKRNAAAPQCVRKTLSALEWTGVPGCNY